MPLMQIGLGPSYAGLSMPADVYAAARQRTGAVQGADTGFATAAVGAAFGAMARGVADSGDSAAVVGDRAVADLMNATAPKKVDMECETCKARKYQDGSDDPGVSFKMPTSIDPSVSASAVLGHESEHVGREQDKAEMEGREVVFQSVVLHGDTCPECGRFFISGGETTTQTRGKAKTAYSDPAAGGGAGGQLNGIA